jgi:hypothetical protein
VLCCCALGGTAFAEETEPAAPQEYQLGDITMDGQVDLDDAYMAQACFTEQLAGYGSSLYSDVKFNGEVVPYEQQLLGCVKGYSVLYQEEDSEGNVIFSQDCVVDLSDAFVLLYYYVDTLAEKTEASFSEWLEDDISKKTREDWIDKTYESNLSRSGQKYGPQKSTYTHESTEIYKSYTIQKIR